MSSIQFEKNEKRNFVFKLILLVIVLLIGSYILQACNLVNSNIDTNLINTTYYTEDLTSVLVFRNEDFGTLINYEYDAEDKEELINEDRHAFNYIIDERLITLTFIDDSSTQELYLLNDSIMNYSTSQYYLLLT